MSEEIRHYKSKYVRAVSHDDVATVNVEVDALHSAGRSGSRAPLESLSAGMGARGTSGVAKLFHKASSLRDAPKTERIDIEFRHISYSVLVKTASQTKKKQPQSASGGEGGGVDLRPESDAPYSPRDDVERSDISNVRRDAGEVEMHSIGAGASTASKPRTNEKHGQDGKFVRKEVLHDVSGKCSSGELLAIMGSTGSGKTSLLNILARRTVLQKGSELSGEVYINGELRKGRKFKSSYVMQDDALFPELTVRETVEFSAMLRLPRSMSDSDKLDVAKECIQLLGLNKCQNTLVGGDLATARTGRGVSGGERKRTSIAVELVKNPPIVFLDECTSGLDAFNAQNVIGALCELANTGGKTIITTLHQPRSAIYHMFSRLLLLAEGRTVYFGAAGMDAVEYFANVGHPCSTFSNPADHMLDIISLDPANQEASGRRVSRLIDLYASSSYHEATVKSHMLTSACGGAEASGASRSTAPGGLCDVELGKLKNMKEKSALHVQEDLGPDSVATSDGILGVSPLRQYAMLTRRCLKVTSRRNTANMTRIVRATSLGIMFGIVYFKDGDNLKRPDSMFNIASFYFMSLVSQGMGALIESVTTIPNERVYVNRERAAGMYGDFSYFITRLAISVPKTVIFALLYCVIAYFMISLPCSFGMFWVTILLVILCAESLGVIISIIATDAEQALAIMPIPFFFNALFSGFLVTTVPRWLFWLKYMMFFWYAFTALLKETYAQAAPGSFPMRLSMFTADNHLTYQQNIGVLVAFVLILNCVSFTVLSLKGKPRYDKSV